MGLDHPVIAIVGAGAVGGYYGARLAQAGFDVHFLLRSDYQTVKQQGWTIKSLDGDFFLPPDRLHVYDRPEAMPKADLVIVTLKATANHLLEGMVAPLIKEETILLTLQNGLGNEALLAEKFGANRVMGGLAFVCINRLEPGVIHHLDHGNVRVGEYAGDPGPRAEAICRIFAQSRIFCEVLPSLSFGRWLKLVWNIPFNGLGAALDLTTDQLINNEDGLSLVRGLMQEVIQVAQAQGIPLSADTVDQQIERTRSMGAYRTSMQIDRQEGRPLEVEAILGHPLKIGQKFGCEVEKMENLYRLVKAVDSGIRQKEKKR